jgi:DNA-binding transcriptional LysR family regulator
MEMHQVRYFLAVTRTLNFTRAAEECNIAQPSLTRAVKLLEEELGGDLFRRERPQAILTPLGERMLPLLTQCFESAQSARMLARTINSGQAGTLKLAVANGIDLRLILPHLNALRETVSDLDFRLLRGAGTDVIERMKSGEAELAVGSMGESDWERLDRWSLFEEPFYLVFNRTHRLANRTSLKLEDLQRERILLRTHCDRSAAAMALLEGKGLRGRLDVASDDDLFALLEANIGVSLLPGTVTLPQSLMRSRVEDLALARSVSLYGVAGRQRSPLAATFVKMLRAAEWPQAASHA